MDVLEIRWIFPPEVWLVIIENALLLRDSEGQSGKPSSLGVDIIRNLCLTCKGIRGLAQPTLFKRIEFSNLCPKYDDKRLDDLTSFFLEHPTAKDWVRELRIEARFTFPYEKGPFIRSWERIIRCLPNLYTLDLDRVELSGNASDAIRRMSHLIQLNLYEVSYRKSDIPPQLEDVHHARLQVFRISVSGRPIMTDQIWKIVPQSHTSLRRMTIYHPELCAHLYRLARSGQLGVFHRLERMEIFRPFDWEPFLSFLSLCPNIRYLGIYTGKNAGIVIPSYRPQIPYFPNLDYYWGPIDLAQWVLPSTRSVDELNITGRMSGPRATLSKADLALLSQSLVPTGHLTLSTFEWFDEMIQDIVEFFPGILRLSLLVSNLSSLRSVSEDHVLLADGLKRHIPRLHNIESIEIGVVSSAPLQSDQWKELYDAQSAVLNSLEGHPLKRASITPVCGTWRRDPLKRWVWEGNLMDDGTSDAGYRRPLLTSSFIDAD